MSFMERIFGTKPPAPAPVAATNNPATNAPIVTQQTQQTDANGVVPQGGGEKSPMEKFATLWDPIKTDSNDPNNKPAEPISAEKIMEAAGKVDFSKVLSQEDLIKIAKGGEEAVGALSGILNKTMQTSYGHSALAATKIVEQAVSQAEERFAAKLPTLINSQSSRSALLSENKAFSNPAVAPIVDMIHTQLTTKFPNASSQEITAMAKEMLQGAAGVFNPAAPPTVQQSKVAASEDFSDYT